MKYYSVNNYELKELNHKHEIRPSKAAANVIMFFT